MDEMIRYIFNSLGNVEGNMSTVVKALKKQKIKNASCFKKKKFL